MAIFKFTFRISRKLMNFLDDWQIKKNERQSASLSANRCAEKARFLAGRITDVKGK